MVSVGTKALDRYGRNITMKANAFAPSTLFATRPKQAASQEIADMKRMSSPATPSQSRTPACGRNPMASATPNTTRVATRFCSTVATTCPISTQAPAIGSDRKRSITPVVMSWATLTDAPAEPKPAHSRMIPGTT